MLDALVGGRLNGAPQRRPGKAETTYVTARLRATAGDNESTVLVNVIAFDETTIFFQFVDKDFFSNYYIID